MVKCIPLNKKSYEATDESYAADVLLSMVILTPYDDKKGTANVKLVKVYKPQEFILQ
jgi:hypothetical protein